MEEESGNEPDQEHHETDSVPASPTKSIKSPGSTISASRSRRNLLDDDEAAQNLRTYQKRIDSIQGVTPKMSLDIRQDFKIEDRIGQLAGVLCANEKLLPRLFEKHVPNKQKTLFVHALAEKLETAPPDMFTLEFRGHVQKPRDRSPRADVHSVEEEHGRHRRSHSRGPMSAGKGEIRRRGGRAISPKKEAQKEGGEKEKVRKAKSKKEQFVDEEARRKVVSRFLPVVCKVAGLTLGKFKDDKARCAQFMCVEDDGTRTGGFLHAVCGTRYKVSPDLAVGGRASEALKTALDKLSSSLLEDLDQRKAVFKKMVEDCAESAKERAPLDRMIILSDVIAAVSLQ